MTFGFVGIAAVASAQITTDTVAGTIHDPTGGGPVTLFAAAKAIIKAS